MSEFDPDRKELRLAIAYAGPPRAGKSTSLRALAVAAAKCKRLVSMPSRVGPIDEVEVRLGRVFGRFTATAHVRVARPGEPIVAPDGVVFVADASPHRMHANRAALEALAAALARAGTDLWSLPVVFQWNKRDLRVGLEEGQGCGAEGHGDALCRGRPCVESLALSGSGVTTAFQRLALPALRRAGAQRALVPQGPRRARTETRGVRRLLEAARAMFA